MRARSDGGIVKAAEIAAAFGMLGVVLTLALMGCPSVPPVVPPPDASDAVAPPGPTPGADGAPSACAEACVLLTEFGCAIGDATASCETFFARDLAVGKIANAVTGKPLTCTDIAAATTKAQIVALGFACPP